MDKTPLSPHLQVYRPQLTSILSITHRATGVVLSLAGTVIILYWMIATAFGPETYSSAQAIFASLPAKIVLLGWTGAFYFHLLNGVRHLLWDTGWGLDLPTAYKTGYGVIIFSILLTISTWAYALQGGTI
jgi:succinate dehydrogenase / fumarate reductase, cytochrome b subunit